METVRRKKVTKNNSVYRNYQAQLVGWIHLVIPTQIIQVFGLDDYQF